MRGMIVSLMIVVAA